MGRTSKMEYFVINCFTGILTHKKAEWSYNTVVQLTKQRNIKTPWHFDYEIGSKAVTKSMKLRRYCASISRHQISEYKGTRLYEASARKITLYQMGKFFT